MSIVPRTLIKPGIFSLLNRSFHSSSLCKEYEGEGKTTVTILNKNLDYGLMIDHVTQYGFILNNGIRTIGPMIAFPKLMLSWNIASSADMNKEAFSLLLNLEPKLDIIVIGLDDTYPHNAPFILNIKELFQDHKIPVEILPVYHACATFNFLNSEHRFVAAGLIPPKYYVREDLLLKGKDKSSKLEAGPNVNQTLDSIDSSNIEDCDYVHGNPQLRNTKTKEYFKVRRPWKDENKKQPPPPDKDDKSS